jgi:hypothetical protein
MPGRTSTLAAISTLVFAGCGSSKPAAMPHACLGQPASVVRALERAPGKVTLADGTPLSRCVSAARAGGDLETLGVTLTEVADGLATTAATDPVAALRLGYLVGAVRRGAAKTTGVAAQLTRRVEQAATPHAGSPRARGALARGIGLGEAGG